MKPKSIRRPPLDALGKSPEYQSLARSFGRFRAEAKSASNSRDALRHEQAASRILEQMGPIRQQLLFEEAQGNAAARREKERALKAARQRLPPLERKLEGRKKELEAKVDAPSGLADQLQALSVLEHRNPAWARRRKCCGFFIMAIDLIPALLKTLMSIGRRSLYEQIQDETEAPSAATVEIGEALRTKQAEREADAQLEVQAETGHARVKAEIAAQQEWDDITINILQDQLRPHIEQWARAAAEQYAAQLADDIPRQANRSTSDRAVRSVRVEPLASVKSARRFRDQIRQTARRRGRR